MQWQWPRTHGEDKYIDTFGGFHIEMALMDTVGDYLEGCGWTSVKLALPPLEQRTPFSGSPILQDVDMPIRCSPGFRKSQWRWLKMSGDKRC